MSTQEQQAGFEGLDANGNSESDYKKAEEECPNGYIVVWYRWEKGFKYRKIDKDGYVDYSCSEDENSDEEEEWSVRGYYYGDYEEQTVDDDYFKSFKTEEEARVFYNSITKEKCNAGKVLYKEPYEEEIILEEVV